MVVTPRKKTNCNIGSSLDRLGLFCCRFFLLLMLVASGVLLGGVPAEAAFQRAIFHLGNLRQSTTLYSSYTQDDSSTGDSSEELTFRESYRLGINYMILDKRLAYGDLDLNLSFAQKQVSENSSLVRSDSSSSLSMEYQFRLHLLERSRIPTMLTAWQKYSTVDDPFIVPYDLSQSLLSLAPQWLHKRFPMRLNYQHRTLETDGAKNDYQQVSDDLRFVVETEVGPGESELELKAGTRTTDREGSPASRVDTYSLYANNELPFTWLDRDFTLYSRLRIGGQNGATDSTYWTWNENLSFILGRALKGGVSTRWNQRSSDDRETEFHYAEFWIGHHLFKSLHNRLEFSYKTFDFDEGDSKTVAMDYLLTYKKLLPWQSQMGFGYNFGIANTTDDLTESIVDVDEEEMIVDVLSFDHNLLHPYVVPGSVVVYNADRTIRYSEGFDYEVDYNQPGNLTLLTFDPSLDGESLSIDYRRYANSNIGYVTYVNAIDGTLELFDGRYKIFGNSRWKSQELTAGEADLVPLNQEWHSMLGFRANFEKNKFSLIASRTETDDSITSKFQGLWQFRHRNNDSDFSLRLNSTYYIVENKSTDEYFSLDKSENASIVLLADYRKKYSSWLTVALRGQVAELMQNDEMHEEYKTSVMVESRWYKFFLRGGVNYNWIVYDDYDRQMTKLSLSLTRYF